MTKMRTYLQDVYKVFSQDETLLRLLTYKPQNAFDDPLDETKENILDRSDSWDIIKDVIKFTPTTRGLVDTPMCRVLFFPNDRSNTDNYLVADQAITIDVFAHADFNDEDLRLSWICDRINDLLFDKRVTGMSRMRFVDGTNLNAPENYVAYRLVYEIGSSKK